MQKYNIMFDKKFQSVNYVRIVGFLQIGQFFGFFNDDFIIFYGYIFVYVIFLGFYLR